MLFSSFKERFNSLSFAILAETFKRIFLLIEYKHKVAMIFVSILNGLVVGYCGYLISPLFDGKVFLAFLLCRG